MTRHSIVIERPIEDVFAVLTDVTLAGRWFPMDVEERWTSPPPHGVGSTRRARIRAFGRVQENDAVVTVYEPPRLAAMEGTSSNAPFTAVLRFAPVESGTRVDVEIGILMGGLMRPIGALFGRWYGGKWDDGLPNLKRQMEAGELGPTGIGQ
jgi:Polyketide cyclase / dehydrase and lipid transport